MKLKYRVTLEASERAALEQKVRSGKEAARRLLYARILLKLDRSPQGTAWTDAQISEALDVSPRTICSIKKIFVEEGLESVLAPQKRPNRHCRKLDGAQEARLIAVACSTPPEGRAHWTMQLLADKLVELKIVESISDECVRTTLKKTNSSPG